VISNFRAIADDLMGVCSMVKPSKPIDVWVESVFNANNDLALWLYIEAYQLRWTAAEETAATAASL
jgi:hypothetical protein